MPTSECSPHARAPQRVLVVNADEPLAHVVRLLLTDAGYDARVATDGAAALEMLAVWRVDLVLLDLCLPQLDGWCLLQKRAADLSLQRVPVLVWSLAGSEDLEFALRLGATACLQRGATDPDQLLERIACLLPRETQRTACRE